MNMIASKKNKKSLISAFMFIFMATFALSGTMLGVLLPRIIEGYSLKLSQAGLINTFSGLGGFVALLLGGIIADKVDKTRLITFTFILFGMLLCSLWLAPPFIILLLIYLIIGMSSSMLNMVISANIADMYPENRGRYLNILHTFFGVGSFIGPLYPTVIYSLNNKWSSSYGYLGIFCLVLATLFIFTKGMISNNKQEIVDMNNKTKQEKKYLVLLKNRNFLLLCIIGFIYMGHQSTFNAWLPTYMSKILNYTETFIGITMTLYWVGMVVGRMVCSYFSGKISPKHFFVIGSMAGTIALICGIIANIPFVWILSVTVLGISTGASYPLILVIACGLYPQNTGSATSLACICMTLSGMLFPWLLGNIAEITSFKIAIWIPVITLMSVFVLLQMNYLKTEGNAA